MNMRIVISVDKTKELMKYVWFVYFLINSAFREVYIARTLSMYMILAYTFILLFQEYMVNNAITVKRVIPWIMIPFLLFYLDMRAMRIWGEYVNSARNVNYSFSRLILPMILCMDLCVKDRKRVNELLVSFLYAMTLFAIIATVTTPIAYWGNDSKYGGITMVQRNLASFMFVLGFAVSLYLAKLYYKRYYLCSLILFIANLITGSRKGVIQVALVMAIYGLFEGNLRDKIKYIRVILILAIIGVVVFMNNPWLQDKFGERFLAIFDDSIEDSSKDNRDMFAVIAWLSFLDKPIFGNGYDGFAVINQSITGTKVYSHSNYLELLCDYGLVGTLIYYFNYFKAIVLSFKYKKDPLAKLIVYSVIPAMIIEYGQIVYAQPIAMAAYVLLFIGAAVVAREATNNIIE